MRKALWLVPLALLIQAGFVHWASGAERPPAIPDLAKFPATLGSWQLLHEDPIEADVRAQLQADQLVSRTYGAVPGGAVSGGAAANLFVAWFQTQSQGTRQPHSPQVCLPGAGWTPIISDRIQIDAGGESLPVNRYVAASGAQQAVILYWYQTSHRAVASEWSSKFWTVWDALSTRRTDIALIRVVTWPTGKDYERATNDGIAFAREMYPGLRASLPR